MGNRTYVKCPSVTADCLTVTDGKARCLERGEEVIHMSSQVPSLLVGPPDLHVRQAGSAQLYLSSAQAMNLQASGLKASPRGRGTSTASPGRGSPTGSDHVTFHKQTSPGSPNRCHRDKKPCGEGGLFWIQGTKWL